MHDEPDANAEDISHMPPSTGTGLARQCSWHLISETCVLAVILLTVTGDILLPRGVDGFFNGRAGKVHENAWRMARAPALIREAPKGRPQSGAEYDERARSFDARAREWIGSGVAVEDAVRKLVEAGFVQAGLGHRVPNKDAYFWRYDADVYCFGAGYVVAFAHEGGIVQSVTGKEVSAMGCE